MEEGSFALRRDYDQFCTVQADWLDDYALFTALQEETGEPFWLRWPDELVRRDPTALTHHSERLRDRIEVIKVLQYFFLRQWNELTAYCYEKKIHLVGDIPIYVQLNSADVWANPTLFKLDVDFQPLFVAGAPRIISANMVSGGETPSTTGLSTSDPVLRGGCAGCGTSCRSTA